MAMSPRGENPPQEGKGTDTMYASVDAVEVLGWRAGFHRASVESHPVGKGVDKSAVRPEEEPEISDEGESGPDCPGGAHSRGFRRRRSGRNTANAIFHCALGATATSTARGSRPHLVPETPAFHLDFMFTGEEEGSDKLAVPVVRERLSRMLAATAVPSKCTGDTRRSVWRPAGRTRLRTDPGGRQAGQRARHRRSRLGGWGGCARPEKPGR